MRETRLCSVDGCVREHKAKGYCNKHYQQITNRVLPEYWIKLCSVEDCTNKHAAKGYCRKHYNQFTRYGKVLPETN